MPLAAASFTKATTQAPLMMVIPAPQAVMTRRHDELSVSSTHSTNTHEQAPRKATSGRRRQRVVRFDECRNTYHDDHVDKEAREDLWYNSTDYKSFKRNHVEITKDIISQELPHKKDASSYLNVMERIYETCCSLHISDLSSDDLSSLRSVLAQNCEYVGVERVTVRCIRLDKKFRRAEVVDAVLDMQDDYYYRGDAAAERMAEMSRQLSQPSRLFAAALAQAHSL